MIASYPSRTVRSSLLVRLAAVSLTLAAGVSAIRAQSLPGSPPAPESAAPLSLPQASPTPAGTPANPAAPSALPVPAGTPATPASQPPAAETPAPRPPGALPVASDPKSPPGGAVAPPAPGMAPAPHNNYIVDPVAPEGMPRLIPPSPSNQGTTPAPGGAPIPMMGNFAPPYAGNGITPSVEDAAARQANAEVLQKLTVSRGGDFINMHLRDALSYIADEGQVDIVIDERAISEAGIDLAQNPLTLRVQSKPIEQLLSLTLRLASPQLDYSIYNGVVFVSSRDALNRRIVTRIYDLPPATDRDAMLQMISTAVGGAKCNFFEQKIVITAPEVAQRDVARLLAQIEPPAQRAKATGGFFLFHLRNMKATEVVAKFPKELGTAIADEQTNAVLINTTQTDRAKDFVSKLDVPSKSPLIQKQEAELQGAQQQESVMHNKLVSAQKDLALLEEQLAAAPVPQSAGAATKERSDEIERLNRKVAEARDARMQLEKVLNDLNRRQTTGQQVIDPNFVQLKLDTQQNLYNAEQKELAELNMLIISQKKIDHAQSNLESLEQQLAAANVRRQAGQPTKELSDEIERLNWKVSEARHEVQQLQGGPSDEVARAKEDAELGVVVSQKKIAHAQSELESLEQQLAVANVRQHAGPPTKELSDEIERLNWKVSEARALVQSERNFSQEQATSLSGLQPK